MLLYQRCKVDEGWFRRLCYSGIADRRALNVETLRRLIRVAQAFNLDDYRKLWSKDFMAIIVLDKVKAEEHFNESKERFAWLWLNRRTEKAIFEPVMKAIDEAIERCREDIYQEPPPFVEIQWK